LWLGIDDDGNTLRLRQRLDEILKINGIEPEARGFRPHLTIARSKDPNAIRELARKHLSTQFGPVEFEAARVTIYESLLRPTGPEYSVIHSIEMTG
jgi:2'-5' RNA ligase